MSSNSAFIEVLTAVYSALSNDEQVMSLVTGVFHQAPDVQPFPYITIGRGQKYPWFAFQNRGASILFQVDIWTDVNDGDSALYILAEIDRLLDGHRLTLNVYNNAQTFCEFATYVPEENEELQHLTARYRTYNNLL